MQRIPSTFSTPEAAFVTGLSSASINKAIERKEIAIQRIRKHSLIIRKLGEAELVYLVLLKELSNALQPLFRKRLYQKLREIKYIYRPLKIELGVVIVDVTEAQRDVKNKIRLLHEASDLVVADPKIRNGEPVVRGTRVPVYLLSDLEKQGASPTEILTDYPSVTKEGLQAALTYAKVHPRRGRPRRGPWHESTDT